MSYFGIFGDSTTDTTQNPQAIGLPADPSSSLPPAGLETTVAAVAPAPTVTNAQSFWGGIKDDFKEGFNYVEGVGRSAADSVEAIPGEIYGAGKSAISTVYNDVESGVSTVVSDVTKPIGNVLSSTYWYVIGAVVVLAGGLYFVGRGGVVGQAK